MALISANEDLNSRRAFAIALVATAIAGAAYLAVSAGRPAAHALGTQAQERPVDRAPPRAVAAIGPTGPDASGSSALSLGVMCGIWQGAIDAFHLSSFVAKGPVAVYDYLVTAPGAAANRSELLSALGITLRDAALGYVGGTVVAVAVALALSCAGTSPRRSCPWPSRCAQCRWWPWCRSSPSCSARACLSSPSSPGIVTFFPTLVNVAQGLRSAPATAFDLFAAYGATDFEILRKARLPYALPAIFASARIAAPGALLGAILAEWLSTGQGLGDLMVTSSSTANYSMLWSAVVAITAVSILLYNAVSAIERPVVARLGITSP